MLLDDHVILSQLDIFRQVGLAMAHDEYIQFYVKNKGRTLRVHDFELPIKNGKVELRFQRVWKKLQSINKLPIYFNI